MLESELAPNAAFYFEFIFIEFKLNISIILNVFKMQVLSPHILDIERYIKKSIIFESEYKKSGKIERVSE